MTLSIDPETPTASIAIALPAAIPIFERLGIDFCCGGSQPLASATAKAGADLEALLEELRALRPRPDDRDWSQAPLDELLDHILDTHHTYTKQALASLPGTMAKVVQAHAERHPELRELQRHLQELLADLEAHLGKEEQILFPMIRLLQAGRVAAAGPPGAPSPAEGPMRVMEMEHDQAALLLRRMRELALGYQLPEDACDTWRALYSGLQGLEGDLHRHIHLENNVLHPGVRRLAT